MVPYIHTYIHTYIGTASIMYIQTWLERQPLPLMTSRKHGCCGRRHCKLLAVATPPPYMRIGKAGPKQATLASSCTPGEKASTLKSGRRDRWAEYKRFMAFGARQHPSPWRSGRSHTGEWGLPRPIRPHSPSMGVARTAGGGGLLAPKGHISYHRGRTSGHRVLAVTNRPSPG